MDIFRAFRGSSSNGEHRRAGEEVHGGAAYGAGGTVGRASVPSVAGREAGGDAARGAGEGPGIIAGEIEAYRCWNLVNGYLVSFNGMVWVPGEPAKGLGVDIGNSSGIYSFLHLDDAIKEYGNATDTVIIGRIKLWGTIVEHGKGFRAEYAKVLELVDYRLRYAVGPHPEILDRVRQRYLAPTSSDPLIVAMAGKDEKLADLERKHKIDCAGYKFDCKRHGDFLMVTLTRGAALEAKAVNLMQSRTIHVIAGAQPSMDGKLRMQYDGFHAERDDYPRKRMISSVESGAGYLLPNQVVSTTMPIMMSTAVMPGTFFPVAGGGASFAPPERSLGHIDGYPAGALDDFVSFEGSGVKLFVPAGLGDGVMASVLQELGRGG
jgi:hypothetical protein